MDSSVSKISVCVVVPEIPVERHTLFLSNMDQWYTYFCRNLFFYENSPGISILEQSLKESISKVLVHYNSWAGRLRFSKQGRLEIDCNNAGVLFATAASTMCVSNVRDENLDVFFLPPPTVSSLEDLPLLTVQVTQMEGSNEYAIGILVHHVLSDAVSSIQFMTNLASIARGQGLHFIPDFDRTRFKARVPPQPKFEHREFVPQGSHSRFARSPEAILNSVTEFNNPSRKNRNMYLFTFEELAKLKQDTGIKCTGFEALCAQVWRCHSATLDKNPHEKLKLRFVMDVRNLLQPPIGTDFCGNAVYGVFVESTKQELGDEHLSQTVQRIQEAKSLITDDYVKSARDYLELHPDVWSDHDNSTMINSWPKLMSKALELDFGWGTPCRVEYPLHSRNKAFVLLPFSKEGIQLSVLLDPPALFQFEKLIGKHK